MATAERESACAQSDFIVSLVALLVGRPRLLTPRMSEAVIRKLLLPLSSTVAVAHKRLLELIERAPQHLPASLVEFAATTGWSEGVRDPAIERSYSRLCSVVPRLATLVAESQAASEA